MRIGDKSVHFIDQWESTRAVDELSLQIQGLSTEVIAASQLGDLDIAKIPNSISAKLYNAVARDDRYVMLEFSPIYKDGNSYRRVTGLTANYAFAKSGGLGAETFTGKLAGSKAGTNKSTTQAKNTQYGSSFLAQGEIFRFYVEETGVHRITRSFLEDLGMDMSTVDPRRIKIYGHGGKVLPQANSLTQHYDNPELAITVTGEQDGVFNSGDEILFYGIATDTEFDEIGNTFINTYTERNYYYIKAFGPIGKRIPVATPVGGTPDVVFTDYDAQQFHEVDENNIVKLGRSWYGNRFDIEPEQTFTFNFPNRVPGEPVTLSVYAAAAAPVNTSMSVKLNGADITTLTFPQVTDFTLAFGDSDIRNVNDPSENLDVSLSYDGAGVATSVGYLNYIALEVPTQLRGGNEQFKFFNRESSNGTGVAEYQLSDASNVSYVWDVTDPYNVSRYSNLNGEADFSWQTTLGELRTYTTVVASDYYTPRTESNTRVSNQDLKGTIFVDSQGQFRDIDYLIITPRLLQQQARRLADHHITTNNLNTKVVLLEDIYQEFSSGGLDIAGIRNFIKYVYDNASSPAQRVQFVAIMGDASFDFRGLQPQSEPNLAPSYLSTASFSLVSSVISDDFFTYMDPNEGQLGTQDLSDIAIGRIIANSPQQASEVVDKILRYEDPSSRGPWRNTVLAVADDVDLIWEPELQENADLVATTLEIDKPFINTKKYYMDAYQQEASAGGDRYPEMTEDLINAMEVGALVVDYIGHGGEDGLAKEFVWTTEAGINLRNGLPGEAKLPVFVTVTCEYSRFDNPDRPTAGEFMFWNPEGGAVGLVTTTREVFVGFAYVFNTTFSEYLFNFGSDERTTVAEALRRAKNSPQAANTANRRVVFFIGDPAMKLAQPTPDVVLTAVNDQPVGPTNDVLEALSRVKLSGEVRDAQGNPITDFNGTVFTTVFDKPIDRTTLGNDGVRDSNNQIIRFDFQTLGETIFRGKSTVTNGQFDLEFIVPRDIGINEGAGKVSFYAIRDGDKIDRSGSSLDIIVGGIDENAAVDNQGPDIRLFMDDESFIDGGITGQNPYILSFLSDENGINTAGGIGHDISAVLDGNEVEPFILNDYYEADTDTFISGQLYYPLRDLEPGLHTLVLKAWDTHDNSSSRTITFNVADSDGMSLTNVLNYPNPFVDYTEFWFTHNRPGEPLDVNINVYTVSGKVVWRENQTVTSSGNLSRDIVWDGRDDFGRKLGKGTYIYKIKVRSTLTGETAEVTEKIVIL